MSDSSTEAETEAPRRQVWIIIVICAIICLCLVWFEFLPTPGSYQGMGRRLRPGMDASDVVDLLGQPYSAASRNRPDQPFAPQPSAVELPNRSDQYWSGGCNKCDYWLWYLIDGEKMPLSIQFVQADIGEGDYATINKWCVFVPDKSQVPTAEDSSSTIQCHELGGLSLSLRKSIRDDDPEAVVQQLLQKGADVNAASKTGNTPLIIAAWTGDLDVIKLLLGTGAKVNAANKRGETPLMLASGRGFAEVVKLLLGAGAKVNAADKNGKSALVYAEGHVLDLVNPVNDKDRSAVTKLLEDAGAKKVD